MKANEEQYPSKRTTWGIKLPNNDVRRAANYDDAERMRANFIVGIADEFGVEEGYNPVIVSQIETTTFSPWLSQDERKAAADELMKVMDSAPKDR